MTHAQVARYYLKFLAAILLISAGAIHSFPTLWMAWEAQMLKNPQLHHLIGAIGFTVGLLNLGVLCYEIHTSLKTNKYRKKR